MKHRYTLGIIAALAFAGCGGPQPPMAAPGALDAHGKRHSQTFEYTGAKQTFVVPNGVTRVTVTAYGASGGASYSRGVSGLGGLVKASIPVTPAGTLTVVVGGVGGGEGRVMVALTAAVMAAADVLLAGAAPGAAGHLMSESGGFIARRSRHCGRWRRR
jgi:hypothetical protein